MPKQEFSRRDFVKRLSVLPIIGALPISEAGAPFSVVNRRPICVFAKHLQWMSNRQLTETVKEIGFDGVDLPVRPGGFVEPARVEQDLPTVVVELQRAGIPTPMITTAITDPDDPHTEPILRVASILGIRAYRMGYIRYDESMPPDAFLETLKPKFAQLAAMNKSFSLHGAYQNHDGTQLGGPVWDLWPLLKDLDPLWMGCQYDIRHATVEGARSWPLALRQMQQHIYTTAIKDFRWEKKEDGWRIVNTPLGEGMVDFKRYFELVKKYDIAGPISVHFEYDLPDDSLPFATRKRQTVELMQRDLETLRNMMAEAGL